MGITDPMHERSYPETAIIRVQRVADSVRHIHGNKSPMHCVDDVVAFCLVRDGEYYVRGFIEHYLGVGVKHIVLMDNGSTDRTIEIASEYDQVTIVECHLPFREYKLAMRIFLVEAYGRGSWCLVVDIDELWEYPFLGELPLTTFVRYLEESGFTSVVAHQLELFAEEPIVAGHEADQYLGSLRYFDISDVYRWPADSKCECVCPDDRLRRFFSGNTVTCPEIPVMARGVRWQLFGITPVLTKVPLFKLVGSVTPFVSSSHRVKGSILADLSCVLLHMCLNQQLFAKAEACVEQGSYFNNSAHYRRIAERLALGPVAMPRHRRLYEGVKDLVALGFLHVSAQLRRFAVTHGCGGCKRPIDRSLSLCVPETQPRGVFEKYLEGKVEVAARPIHIRECKLDDKGARRFAECQAKCEIETVIGTARLGWRSLDARAECIELQKSKNRNRPPGKSRWTEICSMAAAIRRNERLPLAALVHPALHEHEGLLVIDGARRILANVETPSMGFSVVIIRPTATSVLSYEKRES